LWDLSGTDFNLSSDQLSIFAARARKKTNKPQKTAIVALEDLPMDWRGSTPFIEKNNKQR
jgi:hypothetical protein